MIQQTPKDKQLEKRINKVCGRFDKPNLDIDEQYEILAELKRLRDMRSDNQIQFMEQQMKMVPVNNNGVGLSSESTQARLLSK